MNYSIKVGTDELSRTRTGRHYCVIRNLGQQATNEAQHD